jgi:hypothetical protein
MKTNVLGNSDLAITPIGFGAWVIGGDWEFAWGAQDDAQSVAAIHRALDLGANWNFSSQRPFYIKRWMMLSGRFRRQSEMSSGIKKSWFRSRI